MLIVAGQSAQIQVCRLIDEHFTVADLNVAAVLSPSRAQYLNLQLFPHARRWLDACYSRPAAVATRQRFATYVDL